MEDEDGEVVKKYDLPGQQKAPGERDLVSQGLKYMGMGVFAKATDKSASAAEAEAEGKDQSAAGETSAQKARKKSMVEELQDEDDRHIRFTIGGIGRRMTKEDFINEMKKHDKTTRREVVDTSNASPRVKVLAKQEAQPSMAESPIDSRVSRHDAAPVAFSRPGYAAPQGEGSGSQPSSRSTSTSPGKAATVETPGGEAPETEVERGRRLAVLQGVDDEEEGGETVAERRRREAALGVGTHEAEEDSEDDDTPRVPPSRKSIRFADVPDVKGA